MSWWHEHAPAEAPGVPGVVLLLDLPRDATVAGIDQRVASMVERGLVDEVRSLLDQGFVETDPGMSGTGYREIARFLRGACTLEEAMEEIRINTRRYARRQVTWFRHQLPSDVARIDASSSPSERLEAACAAIAAAGIDLDRYARGGSAT